MNPPTFLSPTPQPIVSVIVMVTPDGLGNLNRCLTGLMAQDLGRGRYEILVAGIGIPDLRCMEVMALDGKVPDLRVVLERGAGDPVAVRAAARNRVLALASSPLVTLLEADAVPPPDHLRRSLAAFEAGDQASGTAAVHRVAALRIAGGFPPESRAGQRAPRPPQSVPPQPRPEPAAVAVGAGQRAVLTTHARQEPSSVAVVLPTILRPHLLRAAESVYRQDFDGSIHLLIGIDVAAGDLGLLDRLRADCPSHVSLTVLDLGYSTSRRHGGLHTNHYSGALRTILSFAANARHVAYLDDNDWFGRDHLALLMRAVEGKSWAHSLRWLVDETTLLPLAQDEWTSLGPDRGIDARRFGGFVSPATLLLDKMACQSVLPLWSQALLPNGTGEDRRILAALRQGFSWGATDAYTSFCTLSESTQQDAHHALEFRRRGIGWFADRTLLQRAAERLRLAHAAREARQWAEVAALGREVLAITAYHAEAMRLVALADWKRGRLQDAARHLRASIEIDDGTAEPFTMLAAILEEMGDAASARSLMTRTARRFPN